MSFQTLSSDDGAHAQRRMIELLTRLAPREGFTQASLEDVYFIRADPCCTS